MDAAQGRGVDWYFHEASSAAFAAGFFSGKKLSRIEKHVLPFPRGVPKPDPRIRQMETQCFEWKLRWGARIEEPDALANRLCKTIDGFALLYPEQTQWFWGDTVELLESEGETGRYPLVTIRSNLPNAIKRNACVMDGYDEAFPEDGFFFVVGTNVDDDHMEKGLLVSGGVGSTRPLDDFANDLSFRAGNDIAPSYATFRDTTILLAETWEATCGGQYPPGLTANRRTGWFKAGWMAYLSPKAAKISERPSALIVEERPNGGLFLAATDEVFDVSNAAHLAAARQIERVLDVFNDPDVDNSIPYD